MAGAVACDATAKDDLMRKPELVEYIADRADLSNDKANQVLSAILDEVTNALARKESVSLVGFGTFEVRHRAARKGKNPQTRSEERRVGKECRQRRSQESYGRERREE